MKEATPEAGKKPKTYRFATLGIAEAYEAFLAKAQDTTVELAQAEDPAPEAEAFLEEMAQLRADRRKPKQQLKQTHSLSRLIRRVRVSVKRLIQRKLKQALGRNIS